MEREIWCTTPFCYLALTKLKRSVCVYHRTVVPSDSGFILSVPIQWTFFIFCKDHRYIIFWWLFLDGINLDLFYDYTFSFTFQGFDTILRDSDILFIRYPFPLLVFLLNSWLILSLSDCQTIAILVPNIWWSSITKMCIFGTVQYASFC